MKCMLMMVLQCESNRCKLVESYHKLLKINSKINGTNTRSVIQFRKNVIHPSFDDLDIDIQLKSKN